MTEAATVFGPGPAAPAGALAASPGRRIRNPRILLAATLRWPLAARLAIAFRKLGCPVDAWCPRSHPLELTRAVGRIHRAGALVPQRSLAAAIDTAAPDLVLPCDDAAALCLQRLHEGSPAAAAPPPVRELIERSLGVPASCALAGDRAQLMRRALAAGVRVPHTMDLTGPADLERWAAQHGFPAVLKVDRSWGGLGVAIVRDPGQARAALQRALHPPLLPELSHLLLRRDPSHLLRRLADARAGVSIQAFVEGRPANRAVACWQGEVLAGISVVAMQTDTPTGPASVVRVIENTEMSEAARRMAGALGLSGMCGLDFVVDASSGAAWLIEINPRATPICHLPLGPGHDLPAALHARLTGEPATASVAAIHGDVIAMFPGEWRRNPLSPYLRTAFHDVPWAETELVRDCVGLPWDERGLLARIRARLNPRRAPGVVPFPMADFRAVRGGPPENR